MRRQRLTQESIITTITYILAALVVALAAGSAVALRILFKRTAYLARKEDARQIAESIEGKIYDFSPTSGERLSERIDELEKLVSCFPSTISVEATIKNEARRRESLEESLGHRIDKVATKVDSALMRLGIDPQTGSALDGATPIDARGPLALAQHALNGGNAAGALGHLLEAVRADLVDDIGTSVNEYPNTVRADHVHYDHSDSAAQIAKMLRIKAPGRHAIVIDVG